MVSPNIVSNVIHLFYPSFILTTLLTADTQARIGYFWHITDLHLDTIYSIQGDPLRSCWRIERQPPSSSTRSPGRFGDYLCDSPWSLIESAAKAMKSRQGDNVEFVLWTGDGLSHSAHPMFESKKLEILRNITDLLGRTFSSQFVFPVLGHEDGTTTNFRHMGELWRHWLPSEALQTFEKGGYYSIEQTKSRLRIIALNTNFMRHDPKYSQSHLAAVRQRQSAAGDHGEVSEYKNFYYHHGSPHQQHHGHGAIDWSSHGYGNGNGYGYGVHHRGIAALPGQQLDSGGYGGRVSALSEFENQDTEKQWIWLEEALNKSRSNKETVYIVGHIPPGSDERHFGIQQNGHTTFTESNNKRYLDLVRKYSSIIQGQFFGHLHSDSFRIIYDDKGKPVSWIMISPSVTPRKANIGPNNPAMRLYKFDTDSGQVLDYTQFYLDLQLANTLGEPNWQPEYNLTHYYGLSDISAISLHNFVDRFTSNDASWFAKYYRANSVRYQTEACESVCLLNHYCAITRIDYKEFRQCLEKERNALGSNAPSLTRNASLILSGVCPTLALLFTLAATYCRRDILSSSLLELVRREQKQQKELHQRQNESVCGQCHDKNSLEKQATSLSLLKSSEFLKTGIILLRTTTTAEDTEDAITRELNPTTTSTKITASNDNYTIPICFTDDNGDDYDKVSSGETSFNTINCYQRAVHTFSAVNNYERNSSRNPKPNRNSRSGQTNSKRVKRNTIVYSLGSVFQNCVKSTGVSVVQSANSAYMKGNNSVSSISNNKNNDNDNNNNRDYTKRLFIDNALKKHPHTHNTLLILALFLFLLRLLKSFFHVFVLIAAPLAIGIIIAGFITFQYVTMSYISDNFFLGIRQQVQSQPKQQR